MEYRVYAEDPLNNFLPDIGTLHTYKRPQGLGIRVDDGFEEGMEIPIYYDPMISKLITFGKDREDARLRMIRAIDDYEISGVQTTLSFCKFALQHDSFVSGNFDTNFVKNYYTPDILKENTEEEDVLAALMAAKLFESIKNEAQVADYEKGVSSKWKKNRLN